MAGGVREFVVAMETFLAGNYLPSATMELVSHLLPRVPVRTGRLRGSWVAWANGTEVGRGPEARELRPTVPLGMEVAFSTPKPVVNGEVYYEEGGGKWFDYAPFVYEARPWANWVRGKWLAELIWRAYRRGRG